MSLPTVQVAGRHVTLRPPTIAAEVEIRRACDAHATAGLELRHGDAATFAFHGAFTTGVATQLRLVEAIVVCGADPDWAAGLAPEDLDMLLAAWREQSPLVHVHGLMEQAGSVARQLVGEFDPTGYPVAAWQCLEFNRRQTELALDLFRMLLQAARERVVQEQLRLARDQDEVPG